VQIPGRDAVAGIVEQVDPLERAQGCPQRAGRDAPPPRSCASSQAFDDIVQPPGHEPGGPRTVAHGDDPVVDFPRGKQVVGVGMLGVVG